MEIESLDRACIKWIFIALGQMVDQGAKNCELCQEFDDGYHGCLRCPVVICGIGEECSRIGYPGWKKHHIGIHYWERFSYATSFCTECPECVDLALNIFKNLMEIRDFFDCKKSYVMEGI